MDSWHATFLGRRHLPREVTAFEVEVFNALADVERSRYAKSMSRCER
jgi:hypothetical protein